MKQKALLRITFKTDHLKRHAHLFSIPIRIFMLSLPLIFNACISQTNQKNSVPSSIVPEEKSLIDTSKVKLCERFLLPDGFERVTVESGSYPLFLRELKLKPYGSKVCYFDGTYKTKPNVYCAVIDQEIDKVDLQQCADAVMRLRAEYLYSSKDYDAIHFNFLSDGKPRYFRDYAKGDYSYKKFRAYMRYIFSYANTASLKREMIPVEDLSTMQIGDVFIQSGNPYGHAVIVLDVAENKEGKKIFILAQSYMPAQETQILINPQNGKLSPWFELSTGELRTPEWTFNFSDLRRFKDE
jgi:hypothetical protein